MASWELRVEGKLLEDVRIQAGMNWLWEEHWYSVLRAWLGWIRPSARWVLEALFGLGPSVAGGVRPSLSCSVLQPSKQKRKFSSFFKSLVIELDKELYGPDNHLVEVRWEAPGCAAGLAPHPGQGGESRYPRGRWGAGPAAYPVGAQLPSPVPVPLREGVEQGAFGCWGAVPSPRWGTTLPCFPGSSL